MTAQDLTKEQLQKFFDQPGINKTGICDEAKVSIRTLNNVIAGGRMINGQWKKVNLTDNLKVKLLPVMQRYGF
ncbi:hypothetical protein [Roseivirga seohaensis]|uniref:hypothetical protein n=1 Tax=Roseivirga seohaensis TaxID=1914963 RepID=UPI003BAB6EDB